MSAPGSILPQKGVATTITQNASQLRKSALETILGGVQKATAAAKSAAASAGVNSRFQFSQAFTEESGSYTLSVIFYLLLYIFIGFLIAIFVHYSITPIFRFSPGQKGIIGVPGTSDDKVYWNERTQPVELTVAPILSKDTVSPTGTATSSDDLATYPFINEFSFSIDVLLRKLNESNSKLSDGQVILMKAGRPTGTTGSDNRVRVPADIFDSPSNNTTDILTYYKTRASMILYVTNTNDLILTFFSGSEGQNQFSTSPIKNIPLYQPFRISVVVEKKTFTLYLNGKQAFQRVISAGIAANGYSGSTPPSKIGELNNEYQVFYSPPNWQATDSKCVFIQNLHLWPRVLSYEEVTHAKPALALVPDFDAPKEVSELCVR